MPNTTRAIDVYGIVPAIVALVTGLLYLLPFVKNGEAKQLLLYAYATSFLVVMFQVAGHVVHL